MDKQTFFLISDNVRANAVIALSKAEKMSVVTISPPKRTLDQNALFHALIADIAKSGIKWAGERRTTDEWKALLVSAHAIATGGSADMVRGLEGELVQLRESTASMSKARSTSLIEYTIAFGTQHGVRFSKEMERA